MPVASGAAGAVGAAGEAARRAVHDIGREQHLEAEAFKMASPGELMQYPSSLVFKHGRLANSSDIL